MARSFAYLRVSTTKQTSENQVQEITASGFRVEPHGIVTETVSGSVAISQRPEFARLADRLERGDVVVVTKLDRLGRNAMLPRGLCSTSQPKVPCRNRSIAQFLPFRPRAPGTDE